MSRRKLFLYLTILILVILIQVMILDWGVEVTLFVTWLFLVLTVQHDSRLSVAVSLVFLAASPLLLVAKKDAVAEQAANYAFIFLAIGVLVQVEDLLLERFGWLDRKPDLSPLWQPVAKPFQGARSAAAGVLGRLQAAADRTELVRLVQIVGTVGLAAVFLWAAFSGAHLSILLPLLGAAVLFPFFVWGLRLALHVLGLAWLLRLLLVLILLPLAAAEMIWLHDLVTADRLARMETAYDFVDHLDDAERADPTLEGETIAPRAWTIEEVPHRVLYQHPAFSGASRVAYTVSIGEGYVLAFDLATAPESWDQLGDGVTFAVYVESEPNTQHVTRNTQQIFSTYIDPKQDQAARRWHPYTLDLSEYAGQTVTLIFETGTGPAGDYGYDWAGWGAPRLLAP